LKIFDRNGISGTYSYYGPVVVTPGVSRPKVGFVEVGSPTGSEGIVVRIPAIPAVLSIQEVIMSTRQTLLHIEDDASLQFLFRRLMEREGFDYHCVSGVEQAMAYVEQQEPFTDQAQFPRPDIIVTDLGLSSGPNATELIVWLRQRPEFAHTPIVVLTGGADSAVEQNVMQAGASAFVVKGVGMREMMDRLRAAFRIAGVGQV
jgi:CheY-like chemotaxis protein